MNYRTALCYPLAFILLATLGSAQIVGPSTGDIVISEIMFNPGPDSCVTDANGEYFEITNISNKFLDLNGIYIEDRNVASGNPSGFGFRVSASVAILPILYPGNSFVFARSSNSGANGDIPIVNYAYAAAGAPPADKSQTGASQMLLNNSNVDGLFVAVGNFPSMGGSIIESVSYNASLPPLVPNSGISAEREDLNATWAVSGEGNSNNNCSVPTKTFGSCLTLQRGTPGETTLSSNKTEWVMANEMTIYCTPGFYLTYTVIVTMYANTSDEETHTYTHTVHDDDGDGIIVISIPTTGKLIYSSCLEFGFNLVSFVNLESMSPGMQAVVPSFSGQTKTFIDYDVAKLFLTQPGFSLGSVVDVNNGQLANTDAIVIYDISSLPESITHTELLAPGLIESLPRYNGVITVSALTPHKIVESGCVPYGEGTPGCAGKHELFPILSPQVGNSSFTVVSDRAPANSLGIVLITDAGDLTGSDLLSLGLTLHVDLLLATELLGFDIVSNSAGVGAVILPIPNNPFLANAQFFAQTLWYDPVPSCVLSSPFNLSSSAGLAITIRP